MRIDLWGDGALFSLTVEQSHYPFKCASREVQRTQAHAGILYDICITGIACCQQLLTGMECIAHCQENAGCTHRFQQMTWTCHSRGQCAAKMVMATCTHNCVLWQACLLSNFFAYGTNGGSTGKGWREPCSR